MREEPIAGRMSPLCQVVTRAGKTVQIDIYADGEGGWLLEIEDEHQNSTLWNNPFDTDESALREALRFLPRSPTITWDSDLDMIIMPRLFKELN